MSRKELFEKVAMEQIIGVVRENSVAAAESVAEEELASQARELEIAAGDNTPILLSLHASSGSREHLNKYGEVYPPTKTEKY